MKILIVYICVFYVTNEMQFIQCSLQFSFDVLLLVYFFCLFGIDKFNVYCILCIV